MKIVKENNKIETHTLILVDPGLELKDSLNILEKSSEKEGVRLNKILVCSRLGLKDKKIIYDSVDKLRNIKVKEPYCIIILGKLDFYEEESLNTL
jgi:diphthamide biosynthesis methyltransferase